MLNHMIQIAIVLAMHTRQAHALQAWDPADLTPVSARRNIESAERASDAMSVDEGMLLYIAWHESNFRPQTRTREPQHKVSCGIMTPIPRTRCVRHSLDEQYLIGARHLASWYSACRGNSRCALLGYAGGYRLIRACRGHHLWRHRRGRRVDLCATDALYLRGARKMDGILDVR